MALFNRRPVIMRPREMKMYVDKPVRRGLKLIMQAAQAWELRSRGDARSADYAGGELRAADWRDYDKAMRWLKQERGPDDTPQAPTMTNIDWLTLIPPGWHSLVQPLIDRCAQEGVLIQKVKQKHGGLRFYVGTCSDETHALIQTAQRKSFQICEECGNPATLRHDRDYIRTLCDQHAAARPEDPEALRPC